MANTFKFGNGSWAVKDGFALAYNDENNNFKPLPFDFTRASTATRVDKDGLIETVPSGKPRIDFLNNTSGHLLLEPSRTNAQPYSEQFDNSAWTKGNSSISANQTTAPDGSQTADKWIEASDTNLAHTLSDFANIGSAGTYHFSCFFKKSERTRIAVGSLSGGAAGAIFDLDNGTIVRASEGITTASKIEDFGNGWFRCIVTIVASGAVTAGFTLVSSGTTTTYDGDGSSGLFIWGAQLEAGSYATSYIPTEDSSVTRVIDNIDLTLPDVNAFNSSSGFSVIAKFDISEAGSGSSIPFLFFEDDTSSTYIGFGTTSTNFRCRLNLSGSAYLNTQSNAPRTQKNSLFIACDSSGWSQGANGSTNHTGSNDASVFDKMASITFITDESRGIIKISELLVYNTRLTNTELQNLTS